MAYSASHAQKDAILSLAKEGQGGGGGRVGGDKGRSQDAVSTLPPMGDTGADGSGWLYRTAEITNRAQDRVSPSISALAKHMQR